LRIEKKWVGRKLAGWSRALDGVEWNGIDVLKRKKERKKKME
jgi:hypothetical protein